ncbi:GNAT family N-acetyltransferase [Gudongella sp. DL1XJH-153]|uniref:GNAT family N-acetyltransferase n=1 Tax=Gudongella sp. DL1XJH-153 TaxID=3409804 RepID=UPI003BB498E7
MFVFRRSTIKDIDAIEQIANDGKELLKSNGINQWQIGTYPDRELFMQDIEEGIGYVVSEEEVVVAICAVTFTEEISYRLLTLGSWKTADNEVYATVHRAAVARKHQGKNITKFLFDSVAKLAAEEGAVSVRVDTHPDNAAMNRSLQKAGFEKCGEFYIQEGDEAGQLRYGYEQVIS